MLLLPLLQSASIADAVAAVRSTVAAAVVVVVVAAAAAVAVAVAVFET